MVFKSERELIGVVSLMIILSIMCGKLGVWIPKENFFSGLFAGLAFGLNVFYLIRVRFHED